MIVMTNNNSDRVTSSGNVDVGGVLTTSSFDEEQQQSLPPSQIAIPIYDNELAMDHRKLNNKKICNKRNSIAIGCLLLLIVITGIAIGISVPLSKASGDAQATLSTPEITEPPTILPTNTVETTTTTTMEPTTYEATTIEPTTTESTTIEPTTPKTSTLEPTTLQLTTAESTTMEPTTIEATTIEPTTTEPTTLQPTTEEVATVEPKTAKPTTLQPTTAESTTTEPTTVEATTLEPTTTEPTTLQPTTEEVATVKPKTAKPTTLQPTTAESTTMEPTTVEATTFEPTTAEPTTLQPTTEEATTVEPKTAEPTTFEPTTPEVTTTTIQPSTVEPATPEVTTAEPVTPEVTASDRNYYDDFEQLFQVQTAKKTGLGVDHPWQPNGGNAITMSKDGKVILVTHRDGSLSFIDPGTSGSHPAAADVSIYPPIDAVQLINDKYSASIEYVECRSGIVLSPDGSSENLIVYSVIEGVAAIGTPPFQTAVVDPKVSQSYLVIVKVPNDFAEPGSTLDVMVSDAIPGDAVGTPVLDRDAKYAYVTSNKKTASDGGNSTDASSDQYNAGFLNVVNTGTGGVDFQFPVNVPVSEAAIFHEPEEQFYGGGENDNTNDVVVFIERPSCRECSVDTPEQGEMFAFAFKGPSADPIDPEQLTSLGIKPFKGYMAPVIYNKGRSLILPVTAQNLRLWDNQKFSQNPAIRTPPGIPLRRAQRFEYPDPSGVTVLNDPSPASPVYVIDGDESFFVSNFGRFDVAIAKLNSTTLDIDWFVPTETGTAYFRSYAISKPVVTPDAEYILWTESGTGKNGKLHCVKTDDGSAAFDSVTIPDITTADIALSNDGTTVYAIGDFGLLRAYKIAEISSVSSPSPTQEPSSKTNEPTEGPTDNDERTNAPLPPLVVLLSPDDKIIFSQELKSYGSSEWPVFLEQKSTGELLVFSHDTNTAIWSSGFSGNYGEYYTRMVPNGNLVTREGNPENKGRKVWSTRTKGVEDNDYYFVLNTNDSVSILHGFGGDDEALIWSSKTTEPPGSSNPSTPEPTTPDPTTHEPWSPEPSTPEATTPNPTTLQPTTHGPTTLQPTTPTLPTAEPKPIIPPFTKTEWEQVGNDIYAWNQNDQFGISVSMSTDGDVLAIGAPAIWAGTDQPGSAHVYKLNSNTTEWDLVSALPQVLGGNGSNEKDGYGYVVSASHDGTVIAIGAPYKANFTGTVYIYNLNTTTNSLALHQELGGKAYTLFGASLAVSADGQRLVVTAREPHVEGTRNVTEHVIVYHNVLVYENESHWIQLGNAITDTATNFDGYDFRVSISNDGNVVAVVTNAESFIKIFKYNESSNSWDTHGRNNDDIFVGDYLVRDFEHGISLSSSGDIVAAGTRTYRDGISDRDGEKVDSVTVFQLNPDTDNWVQMGNDIRGEVVGRYEGVKLSANGMIIAIGSILGEPSGYMESFNSGTAIIYEYDSSNEKWIQISQDIGGHDLDDHSGRSISLSGDGSIVAIGATGSSRYGSHKGYVRVYRKGEEF